MKHTIIGNIGQWLSVFIMFAGIYLLYHYKIDYGTIVFTVGCVIETLATKIKYYGDEYIKHHRKLTEIVLYKEPIDDVKSAGVASESISRVASVSEV